MVGSVKRTQSNRVALPDGAQRPEKSIPMRRDAYVARLSRKRRTRYVTRRALEVALIHTLHHHHVKPQPRDVETAK